MRTISLVIEDRYITIYVDSKLYIKYAKISEVIDDIINLLETGDIIEKEVLY